MKKQIFIATLALGAIVFGTISAQAQATEEAISTVNLTLNDLISIEVTTGDISFEYSSFGDYGVDQISESPTTLRVSSTQDFNITAKANTAHFTTGESTESTIPSSILEINQSVGDGGTMNPVTFKPITETLGLSASEIVNTKAGIDLTLDLDYRISAEKAKSDLLGKKADDYSLTVTYTATSI